MVIKAMEITADTIKGTTKDTVDLADTVAVTVVEDLTNVINRPIHFV